MARFARELWWIGKVVKNVFYMKANIYNIVT